MSGFLSGMKLWGIIFLSSEQSDNISHLIRRRTHIQVAKYLCDHNFEKFLSGAFFNKEVPVLILTTKQKKDSSVSHTPIRPSPQNGTHCSENVTRVAHTPILKIGFGPLPVDFRSVWSPQKARKFQQMYYQCVHIDTLSFQEHINSFVLWFYIELFCPRSTFVLLPTKFSGPAAFWSPKTFFGPPHICAVCGDFRNRVPHIYNNTLQGQLKFKFFNIASTFVIFIWS